MKWNKDISSETIQGIFTQLSKEIILNA